MSSVYVVCWMFLQTFQTYFCIQANSEDPDQTTPRGAVWSGSTLFAKITFKITSRWQSRRQLLWLAVLGLNTAERDVKPKSSSGETVFSPLPWSLIPSPYLGYENGDTCLALLMHRLVKAFTVWVYKNVDLPIVANFNFRISHHLWPRVLKKLSMWWM